MQRTWGIVFFKGGWRGGVFKSLNNKLTVYCHLPLQQMLRKGWTYWEGKGYVAHLGALYFVKGGGGIF